MLKFYINAYHGAKTTELKSLVVKCAASAAGLTNHDYYCFMRAINS